jgi:peptidyl-prolyl cis-trans isomerase SurA
MNNRTGFRTKRRLPGGVAMTALVLTLAASIGNVALGQRANARIPGPFDSPTPQVTLPVPPAVTTNGTVVEFPIARVNDAIIDNSDYQRQQQQLTEEGAQANVNPAELAQRQKDLLRDMIDQQLLLSRGKELGINADAEVIRQLDEVRKSNHLESMEDLQKAVRSEGISYEDYTSTIRNRIITGQVVRDEVGRKLSLTAREEQAYYDKHKQEFAKPEQVRLSEILIPTPEDATDAQIAQAQTKAEQAVAKLKAGAKFADIARQYSGGPNADTGGDLGEFARGVLPKVLEDQTFPLKPGEWTAPIRTKQGFVVLQVTQHQAAGIPPLSAVDEQVQEAIYQEAIQPKLREYLTGLREKAYLDIAPGFVDTGASPKETKPVFAAATAPAIKKKVTQQQKARLVQGRTATTAVTAAGDVKPGATTGATSTAGASTRSAGTTSASTGAGATAPGTTAPAKTVNVASSKKPRKIKREKIRYGQAPRESLPAIAGETLAAGADQGAGATPSTLQAPTAIASLSTDTDTNPLAPQEGERRKTRYSDRAQAEAKPAQAKVKVVAKAVKAEQKAAAIAPPMTAEEKATQQTQSAALGLSGDTATKKKKKKVKGAPKERIQEQAPAPPKPAPEATPIPPKSVRDNGEPVVTPPPANLPPATPPADAQPATSPTPAPGQ